MALGIHECQIEFLGGQFIEERMADVFRVNAALAIPRLLERQGAQDVIDEAGHLLDLAQPAQAHSLRRHEIENGDAVKVRSASDPPVETGIVDQDDGVGALMAEMAIGLRNQAHQLGQARQHVSEAHDGMLAQIEKMVAARVGHPIAAEADAIEVRVEAAHAARG